MTLLFIDSFDHYSTGESNEKGYSIPFSSPTITISNGRRTTASMRSDYFVNGSTVKQSFTASDGVVVGCALNFNVFSNRLALEIEDSGGNSLALFEKTSAGEFRITSGGQVALSGVAAFTPATYSYYELKYLKGTGANATCELRKDGIAILTITTSTETAQGSACEMLEGWQSGADHADMDDLYILNTLGSTNNDYLGDVRVDAHYTDADGAAVEFVPNTGAASFTHVDDPLTDGDTTFVEAGNIANRDLYSVDAASLGTTVYGVQQNVSARKTDAGIVDVEVITEKPGGGGEQSSAIETASDNYKFHLAILESDPDDAVTWDDTRINATEWGFKINNITT